MSLFDVTQAALEKALSGSALRQKVLSDNLANVNTAGFKRSDVDFQTALKSVLDDGESSDSVESIDFAPQTDNSGAVRADGNSVDVDSEMASLQENAVTYQALVTIAKSRSDMIRGVLGSR